MPVYSSVRTTNAIDASPQKNSSDRYRGASLSWRQLQSQLSANTNCILGVNRVEDIPTSLATRRIVKEYLEYSKRPRSPHMCVVRSCVEMHWRISEKEIDGKIQQSARKPYACL